MRRTSGKDAEIPASKDQIKFGIWLETAPFSELTGEGIYQVLMQLLRATSQAGAQAVIACANWTRDEMLKVMREAGVPHDNVEILTPRRRTPIVVSIGARLLKKRRPRPPRKLPSLLGRIRQCSLIRWALSAVIGTDSYLVFAFIAVPFLLLVTVVSVLMLPFLVLAEALGKLRSLSSAKLTRLKNYMFGPQSRFGRLRKYLFGQPRRSVGAVVAQRARSWLAAAVKDSEYRALVRRAAKRKDIEVWFVPHPAAGYAKDLGVPLVAAVPDFVYAEFPTTFDHKEMEAESDRIDKLVGAAAETICHCRYVRDLHVVGRCGVPEHAAHVIPHAPMSLAGRLARYNEQFGGDTRQAALAIMHSFIRGEHHAPAWAPCFPRDYLVDFPFDEVTYLFVSSQVRPHKNYLALFRVFEKLLRRRYMGLKLFFTGSVDDEPYGLREFIRAAHLELDVISVPRLPAEVHAAFYHLAALTVVPTLFEGAFPFPFSESVSVGTPAILSSIPATREVLPPALAEATLFDPYDVDDIAGTIQHALSNRDQLLAAQRTFCETLRTRTWLDVAADYLAVFKRARDKCTNSLRKS